MDTAFLEIPDLPNKGDKHKIEIGSVQFGVGRNISTPVGQSSKREATPPNISEVTVTHLMDKYSP